MPANAWRRSGFAGVVAGDTRVIPGVEALVTGGHTADHQVIFVREGGEAFIHLADIVPTRSHIKGPWNQAYDLDALTMERKAHYLEQRGSTTMVDFIRP